MDIPDLDSHAVFNLVAELSHDGLIVTRLDGTILSWSRGAEQIYGYTEAEARGQSIQNVCPEERSDHGQSLIERIRSGGRTDDQQTLHQRRDGRLVDVLLSVCPLRRNGGVPSGAVIVARDLTRRNRAEDALASSEERWRTVINATIDAMIVIDTKGIIQVFNPAAERLFGYSEHEAKSSNISMLMPSPHDTQHDAYIESYLRSNHAKVIGIGREVIARRKDGTTFPLHLSVGEMRVGAERQFVGILHDLTARVQLEERVREQTALARLGEMAAVVAHEVRNPLAAVRGAIQVIGGHLPAGSRDHPIIAQIVERIDALEDLLKDMLLFSRTPTPKLASMDLLALLRLTTMLLSEDPAFALVRFDIVESGSNNAIQGDPELLTIAFQNLLINAAQAMHNRGLVTVTLKVEGDIQRVDIADAGPGLSEDALANLFRPFFTTKSHGTGLGLSTTKRLVELHSGSIAVMSRRGAGTVVSVSLPSE